MGLNPSRLQNRFPGPHLNFIHRLPVSSCLEKKLPSICARHHRSNHDVLHIFLQIDILTSSINDPTTWYHYSSNENSRHAPILAANWVRMVCDALAIDGVSTHDVLHIFPQVHISASSVDYPFCSFWKKFYFVSTIFRPSSLLLTICD